MKLPSNLLTLYQNKWLGVKLIDGLQSISLDDEEEGCTIEPNMVYLVTYLSLQHERGIFQIDEDNSVVFNIQSDLLEFEDIHSDILN